MTSRRQFLRSMAVGAALALAPFLRERPPVQWRLAPYVYFPYMPLYTTSDIEDLLPMPGAARTAIAYLRFPERRPDRP